MIKAEKNKALVDEAKRTIDDYNTGYLEADMGYKFRTRAFLEVVFLYVNGVDVRNPDILGKNNKNTFVNEAESYVEKIKEQIRMDIKDLNFLITGASALGQFIPKAANRKMLEENNFADDMDDVPDNAAVFGSGFLKVWESDKKMNIRSIDPFYIIFNQYNFKDGLKIERMRKTYRWIIDNEKYDKAARHKLSEDIPKADWDKEIVIYQVVKDLKDGGQEISVLNVDREEVYYNYESKEKVVSYYKFDYKKRKGFPDALGVGCYEKVFNKIVQSKVNRERMDRVMEVASILAFQKQMDNERDNYVGKEMVKLKPTAILGHKGNKIELLDTGGIKQANIINQQLGQIISTIGNDLNVSEALAGNTLPSGTSGTLGNLLTENSSSVLKEVKKNYAKFIDRIYHDRLNQHILDVFDSATNLKEYLDPNDITLIQTSVIDYLVAQKQIDAAINDVPFDLGAATEAVKREIKGKPLISGSLLDKLREEVKGIRTYISGEAVSKLQTVSFLREMRATFAKNPELFKSPFYIETLKKEAEFDAGISGIEIDNLLKELV
jgi:hypothetical protein